VFIQTARPFLAFDESTSTADLSFQTRAEAYFAKTFESSDLTVLMASHAVSSLQNFCQRAIWLEHGSIRLMGPVAEVVAQYEAFCKSIQQLKSPGLRPAGTPVAPAAATPEALKIRTLRARFRTMRRELLSRMSRWRERARKLERALKDTRRQKGLRMPSPQRLRRKSRPVKALIRARRQLTLLRRQKNRYREILKHHGIPDLPQQPDPADGT